MNIIQLEYYNENFIVVNGSKLMFTYYEKSVRVVSKNSDINYL